jgi:hypothetical protein
MNRGLRTASRPNQIERCIGPQVKQVVSGPCWVFERFVDKTVTMKFVEVVRLRQPRELHIVRILYQMLGLFAIGPARLQVKHIVSKFSTLHQMLWLLLRLARPDTSSTLHRTRVQSLSEYDHQCLVCWHSAASVQEHYEIACQESQLVGSSHETVLFWLTSLCTCDWYQRPSCRHRLWGGI